MELVVHIEGQLLTLYRRQLERTGENENEEEVSDEQTRGRQDVSDRKDDIQDRASAHRKLSAECFNRAWEFIGRDSRTPEEEEEMLRLAMASHWHWTQRGDYGPVRASVAYWQISRVFALMGQADNARRFGSRCVASVVNEEVDPFYVAYGYEALARAEAVAGNTGAVAQHLATARGIAPTIEDEANRRLLEDDLNTIHVH